MTVLGAFHRRPLLPALPARGPACAALSAVLRRLADSPLDSAVLQALGSPTASRGADPVRRTVRMRASWQTVTATDGTSQLEARWVPES
ncbi:hypothetical protein [Kitasatospora viridis]|uniref:Uncharacterized protein n=1 Tax=Kitasatospora viridis TaxID=281105 RepID=A0A561T6C2_9ACTN|nr:hypothetical protein [Kitasatospora viridis]TWF82654.1 hypothetical protein FHX73_14136 [Kitasatospora viridis]